MYAYIQGYSARLQKQIVALINVTSVEEPNPNPLDGCVHVYLDMGTNRGVQIRKLYESEKFEGAAVLPIFEQYFGKAQERNLNQICAVGFEPNSMHTKLLKSIEVAYHKCGWRVTINTETGVVGGITEGKIIQFHKG